MNILAPDQKARVIETKRQPSLWTVKAGYNIQAAFHGPSARAQAEAYAAEHHGTFETVEKPPTGKALRRAAWLAERA